MFYDFFYCYYYYLLEGGVKPKSPQHQLAFCALPFTPWPSSTAKPPPRESACHRIFGWRRASLLLWSPEHSIRRCFAVSGTRPHTLLLELSIEQRVNRWHGDCDHTWSQYHLVWYYTWSFAACALLKGCKDPACSSPGFRMNENYLKTIRFEKYFKTVQFFLNLCRLNFNRKLYLFTNLAQLLVFKYHH